MAKKKKKEEAIDWNKLAAGAGVEVLEHMETVPCWIDTGILALNYICSGKFIGGGIPSGRVIEIFGDSSSGKTLIGTNILKGCQTMHGIPILLDAERAISKDFAKQASKIDAEKFFVTEADTLEGCFNKIYTIVRKLRESVPIEVPIVIAYDSIAASPSEREFAEVDLDMETASKTQIKEAGAGADKPGERARICSKEFRKLPAFLKEHHATLVVINQLRMKIGVMFGDPRTGAGGGRALEYYSSLRLEMRSNRITKDKNGNVLGVNVNVKNAKSRCFKPFMEANRMYLFFEQGINPFGGLLEILIQTERIKGANGNWTVQEPYADGREIKFRSSKERNDVPSEVLLNCPALVDADSKEQVEYYIDLYRTAIDAVDKDVPSENEDDCSQTLG